MKYENFILEWIDENDNCLFEEPFCGFKHIYNFPKIQCVKNVNSNDIISDNVVKDVNKYLKNRIVAFRFRKGKDELL